jgi:Flp pilus assembly protein TadD
VRPETSTTLSALSSALMDASEPEEALQVARRAVDIDPASSTAVSALGYALLDVQQTARAIETFERAQVIQRTSIYWPVLR